MRPDRGEALDQSGLADASELGSLLEATSRGDMAAFRALYEATAPKLLGVVIRITGNKSVAEDVLQETYLKVWQRADLFLPGAGRPLPWLIAIARNRAIDRIRSDRIERHRAPDDDGALLERLPAPSGDPTLASTLRTCLSELDEETRRCVVMAYCFGFSREELAEKFARPVGTIKTLLHRSVKLLRACLEKE